MGNVLEFFEFLHLTISCLFVCFLSWILSAQLFLMLGGPMFYLFQKINSQTSTRMGNGQLAQAQRVENRKLGPNCLSNILQSVLLYQHSLHLLPCNFRGFHQFLNLNLKSAFSTVSLQFTFLGFANLIVTCLLFFMSPKLCFYSFLPCSIIIDSHLTK